MSKSKISSKESARDVEKERELKFKYWLQTKALKEKAFEYLERLNVSRAEERESVLQVGVALCAVERCLQETEQNLSSFANKSEQEGGTTTTSNTPSLKTLQGAFRKWIMDHHSFNNVLLTSSDLSQLSGAAHEFIEKEKDPETGKEVSVLPSLKYFFPAIPKPNMKTLPASSDQKVQNAIFLREVRLLWNECKKELDRKIEILQRGSARGGKEEEEKAEDSKEEKDEEEEKSTKERSESKEPESSIDIAAPRNKSLTSILNDLSIKVLREWIEEDEDKAIAKTKADLEEKISSSKKSHEQFVKHKDSLRIRLPDASELDSSVSQTTSSRFSHGRELTSVRPASYATSSISRTTVELMAGSGLKYVHATDKGRNGMMGDLERSREKLLSMGFVKKENFDLKDPDSRYSREEFATQRLENKAIRSRVEKEERSKEEAAKAYDEWMVIKDLKEQALKCLSFLPPPTSSSYSSSPLNSCTSSALNISRSTLMSPIVPASIKNNASIKNQLTAIDKSPGSTFQQAISVGRALKQVDRSLLNDWIGWCKGLNLSTSTLMVIWDFLPPKCCDVHSAAYSQVKETFRKLLRPGVDYQDTFQAFCEKKWSRQGRTSSSSSRLEATSKEAFASKMALTKKEMESLLRQLGIVMNDNELRLLIDAFDTDGDGVITMAEFLDFVGPKRDRKAGVSKVMNQLCSFNTTCKVTGMPYAYTISQINTVAIGESEAKEQERGGEEEKAYLKSAYRTSEVIVLKNGEKRTKLESMERRKREVLLRMAGLLDDDSSKRQEEEGDENYDDNEDAFENEFDYDNYDGDDNEGLPLLKKKGITRKKTATCEMVRWTLEKRRKAVKKLTLLSKSGREESTLKELLSSGLPPKAPQIWCGKIGDADVRGHRIFDHDSADDEKKDEDDEDGSEGQILTREILIHWMPSPGDLVSFFSLEFGDAASGKTPTGMSAGSGTNGCLDLNRYREVYRDPPNSNPDHEFSYKYWMRNLKPCTGYLFRLRAINGYGPGEYVYKTLWTRGLPPEAPKITHIMSDSVGLRWVFSDVYLRKENELRLLFEEADADQSGTVSREELLSLCATRVDSRPELKAFLTRVLAILKFEDIEDYAGLFDLIEGDDDGTLTFDEFEAFFHTFGWGLNTSMTGSASNRTSSSSTSGGPTYVISCCESELNDAYTEVLQTSKEYASIHRLEPGKSYRFRIHSLNPEGVASAPSPSIVVHTALETPAPPFEVSLEPRQLTIGWIGRNHVFVHSKDKERVKNMLGEWAGHVEEDHAVSIEAAFAKYDVDRSGSIDKTELTLLLEDLHVDPSEERIAEALLVMDSNQDGLISYEEFSAWWRSREVSYTIKRSEAISSSAPSKKNICASSNVVSSSQPSQRLSATSKGLSKLLTSTAAVSKKPSRVALPVVSYRGNQTQCIIAGLTPNRLYHFALRQTGPRAHSQLSNPLALMTLPLPSSAPVLIRTSATVAMLKWYPPEYGVFKFSLQLQCDKDSKWNAVYSGQETVFTSTTLVPDSTFAARVVGYNAQGKESIPSPVCSFHTLERGASKANSLMMKNAERDFTIECTGDISVGDTILITERLFIREVCAKKTGSSSGLSTNSLTAGSIVSNARSVTGRRPSTASDSIARGRQGRGQLEETEDVDDDMTLSQGIYIGERSIAAHVVRDNYRTARDAANGNLGDKKFSKSRRLWLEVVWQKASSEACKPYELKAGVVIERIQSQIEKFEVFRVPWVEEPLRRPLREELTALAECYLDYE